MADWQNQIVGWDVVAPDQLLAHPGNFRRHPVAQREALRGSLNELGIIAPVLVNRTTGHLLDGHARVEEYLTAGIKGVPVAYLEIPADKESLALLSLDPIAAMAEADKEALDELLHEAQTEDAGLQAMLAALAKGAGLSLEKPAREDPGAQIDKAEELREKWGTERGQIWQVGEHRIMCGDSTSAEDVGALLDQRNAVLCATDPPYNVDIDYGTQSSDSKDHDEYLRFTEGWFRLAREAAAQVLLTPGTGRGFGMPNLHLWFSIARPDWILVWVKKNTVGHSSLGGFNAWEPIFFYGKPKKKVGQDIYDIPITVQKAAADESGNKLHPTPKQVKLWAALLDDFSDSGDIVYEPFIGSGTTAVAAEQLGRVCYGMEIEPKYVAVTLERLSGMGMEPRLI